MTSHAFHAVLEALMLITPTLVLLFKCMARTAEVLLLFDAEILTTLLEAEITCLTYFKA